MAWCARSKDNLQIMSKKWVMMRQIIANGGGQYWRTQSHSPYIRWFSPGKWPTRQTHGEKARTQEFVRELRGSKISSRGANKIRSPPESRPFPVIGSGEYPFSARCHRIVLGSTNRERANCRHAETTMLPINWHFSYVTVRLFLSPCELLLEDTEKIWRAVNLSSLILWWRPLTKNLA